MLLPCRVLVLIVSVSLAVEPAMRVAEVLQAAMDDIETETEDGQLARRLEHFQLAEPLREDDIRWLSTAGAGAKTLKALRKLQERSASMNSAAQPAVTFEPRPTTEESNRFLRLATDYVQRYTATLVDFTCTATVRTYTKQVSESRPLSDTSIVVTAPGEWKETKTVAQEINYYRGREYYSAGKRSKQDAAQGLTPGASWTNGEFAQALRITFASATQAHFEWNHWEQQGNKKLAVFSYAAEAGHSQFVVDTQVFQTGVWQNTRLAVAYHGFIFVDPESGAVVRLIANTTDIPSQYAINQGNTVLDYSPVVIAGKTYFLLTNSVSYINTKQYKALFRKTFTNYKKFEAESRIVP